jgi:hypothetical protein
MRQQAQRQCRENAVMDDVWDQIVTSFHIRGQGGAYGDVVEGR